MKLTVISISKLYVKSKSLISIRHIHIFYVGIEENGRFLSYKVSLIQSTVSKWRRTVSDP